MRLDIVDYPTLTVELRIPMRGYEMANAGVRRALRELRIPMRGYETKPNLSSTNSRTVTNPHEGL